MKIIATPNLNITKLHEDAQVSAEYTFTGFSLASVSSAEIMPSQIVQNAYIVHTGIAVESPKGYIGKIFLAPKVGMETKLRLAHGTGIITSDYTGELMLYVENIGRYSEYITKGQCIAQLVVEKLDNMKVTIADSNQ